MEHSASTAFWRAYDKLPHEVRLRADKQFALLEENPNHPSLQFKKVGSRHSQEVWSARVSVAYRALAIKRPEGYLWFWIGDHGAYETLIS